MFFVVVAAAVVAVAAVVFLLSWGAYRCIEPGEPKAARSAATGRGFHSFLDKRRKFLLLQIWRRACAGGGEQ